MPLRGKRPLNFVAKGVSDTLDSTNAFPGAMAQLSNLVPNPSTMGVWVPRPASSRLTNFPGFTTPTQVTALFENGTRIYGMISSADFPGLDEPFVYDVMGQQFVPITGMTTALLPKSPNTTGDWTPPQIAMIGSRIIFTHPGFAGGSNPYFGWLDISKFTLNTLTGNTTTGSLVITSISGDGTSNPIGDGVQPGQTISDGGVNIPPNTYVVKVSNANFSLNTTGNTALGQTLLFNVASIVGTDITGGPDNVQYGMYVTGSGIPAGTTVVSIGNFILRATADLLGNFNLNTTGDLKTGSITVSNVSNLSGVVPGMTITGPGIPSGTTVTAVSPTSINMSAAATNTQNTAPIYIFQVGSNQLTNVSNTTGVLPGMKVTATTGIPDGTLVVQVSGTVVTISQFPTGTGTGVPIGFNGGTTVTISQAATATVTGEPINFSGGGSITISHPAVGTANGVHLQIAGGTPQAPLWFAGNTNTNLLPSVPTGVAQFNSRAYYACGNAVVVSDALNPTQRSNAAFVLTLGDNQPITALKGLPLENQVVGGIIQSIMAFKGTAVIFQITGDPALNNWFQNVLNVAVGTLSPNSVVSTPRGMAFIAPDGLRFISFNAQIGDPVGAYGSGVSMPFINAQTPSRICAAYNQNVLRISVANAAVQGSPVQEWWYDFELEMWTGPHTFPAALIIPFYAVTPYTSGHGFVMTPAPPNWNSNVGLTVGMFASDTVPLSGLSYTENGVPLSWVWETSLLPDNSNMSMNAVIETALALILATNQTVTITASDENGIPLDSVTLTGAVGTPTIWGAFTWGQANWLSTGPAAAFKQQRIAWHKPLVFKQMQVTISGPSEYGFALGNLYLGVEPLGYMLQQAS